MTNLDPYIQLLKTHVTSGYRQMFRESGGALKYPFLTPGSDAYPDVLWDWDSWLANVALRQILMDLHDPEEAEKAVQYEQGCVLNFLDWCRDDGWIPIEINRSSVYEALRPVDIYNENMHKPVLAQHAAFLTKCNGGDAEWLREKFPKLQSFINTYRNHHKHSCGLYYWQNDNRIGVDNDPCTYYRPPKSSASFYLNSFMYKEILALVYLCNCLRMEEIGEQYQKDADQLLHSIQEHCWDERDGFFYSVDLHLLPVSHQYGLHCNQPRHWDCLVQRIGVWTGFMGLWAKIATPAQAERIVAEHYHNSKTFHAPFGVRSLSKMEKMYNVRASGNPSSWLGPIWGITNYITFKGLVHYGFHQDAKELVEKTILLFGRDIERFGAMHEYYLPENGEPVLNRGFQDWNNLVLNMIAWYEGRPVVEEF